MTDWWDHLWNDPMKDNPWALGLLILCAAVWLMPTLVMMGRDVFRRRKQETMSEQQKPVEAETFTNMPITETHQADVVDEKDPQAETRRAAMAEESASTESMTVVSDRSATLAEDLSTLVTTGYTLGADSAARDVQRWRNEGIPPFRASVEMPKAAMPAPLVSQSRVECEHCGGRGFMPGINDHLRESVALLGDQGDEVVRLFYSALLRAHPQLLTLFPGNPTQGDFGSDHKGAQQRDRLLKALIALADLYDPGSEAKLNHLDQALASFGRAHASFVRQDGTIKGATLEEYAAVKEALFSTLVSVAADKWRPEYTEAWGQAYDYAAAVMLAEQFRSGFAAPRFPRATQGRGA